MYNILKIIVFKYGKIERGSILIMERGGIVAARIKLFGQFTTL
jgi:hypothetical protein